MTPVASAPPHPALPPPRPAAGGVTLEQRLAGAWDELRLRGAAPCPVCGGQMTRRGGGGRCGGCGARLD